MGDIENAPYVVLLGDVGTGKSTLVEKMTGQTGSSSGSSMSYTRSTEVFWVSDSSLLVADTPGSNALEDKLEQNVWIAGAVSRRPVSKIFIVVKAEARIDSVVSNVRKYADCFVELPMDVVAVIVTHMDAPEVKWAKKDFIPKIDKELGIDTVVFSSLDAASKTLVCNVLKTCEENYDLTVDNENFFKLFKIHNNHRKILKSTSNEVNGFVAKKKAFDNARKAFRGKNRKISYVENTTFFIF
ncbi:signal recognition particle receptor beta subunit [Paramuricea clavata]|uniref:Signal recognition particle receptor beta subunit n=1 Tax=Paramuricea clavata TaxID=317549 RepID=A0A6S7HGU5_PARCT|nr:signal recognition particle receptor beta subunit [Paramuricea clavata]